MLNKVRLNVIMYLDNNKVQVELNNKKYIRTVKKDISDKKYIVINKNEYLV